MKILHVNFGKFPVFQYTVVALETETKWPRVHRIGTCAQISVCVYDQVARSCGSKHLLSQQLQIYFAF